nr:hypothetical protein [Colwellia sp. UCD-KL20]
MFNFSSFQYVIVALIIFYSTQTLAEEAVCQNLSEAHCLTNNQCTLNYISDNNYSCDIAKNSCEQGFTQWTLFPTDTLIENNSDKNNSAPINYEQMKSCEIKVGCKYSNAEGYCEPGFNCAVTGGKPAMCEVE